MTHPRRTIAALVVLTLLGFLLRLLVWRWREFYELGGDESEYFGQALTFLQGGGYRELQLMRPPLYTVFLAVVFQLLDSQVQRVRLVQALISSATIPLFWLWARELFWSRRRDAVALMTAGIAACCYTFAANATELLTETLFVGGLVLALWLILLAARSRRALVAALAGLSVGLLCLLRSVALPLVPLAALYLLVSGFGFRVPSSPTTRPSFKFVGTRLRARPYTSSRFSDHMLPGGTKSSHPVTRSPGHPATFLKARGALRCSVLFVLCSILIIAPWTVRNYLRYDAFIVIDTTGAENLWLDNDPAGREAVKRQLYELGVDRGLRQRLGIERGRDAIAADLPRFAAKAWTETVKFVALEYFDDLRERRAIWVRPADVWLRLLLGDAVWLLVLLGGSIGLWLVRFEHADRADPRWLLVPWALYVFVTGLVFHVELRYRLPLYPALLPFAAYLVVSSFRPIQLDAKNHRTQTQRRKEEELNQQQAGISRSPGHLVTWSPMSSRRFRCVGAIGALLSAAAIVGLLFAQRNYLAESAMLARKHWFLRQAHAAVLRDGASQAYPSAERALELDPQSALARVYLGRSSVGDEAIGWWREAIDVLPAHPYAHLLLGNALREAGNDDAARIELAFETSSLEDLQRWSRDMFGRAPEAGLDIGDGLDLGAIGGFYPARNGARWTARRSEIYLLAVGDSVSLRLRSRRPPGASPANVEILVNGRPATSAEIGPEWRQIDVAAGGDQQTPVIVTLQTNTFRPRDYNRAEPDNRELGVEVDWVK